VARYHFNVRDGFGGVADTEGTELPDIAAARAYAHAIVRELMFGDETKKRHHWLVVCDAAGQELFELSFLAVDQSLSHLNAESRRLIEQMCEKRLALTQAAYECRMNVLRVRANIARARARPYLATEQGHTIPVEPKPSRRR
jgi:hypothetical protein